MTHSYSVVRQFILNVFFMGELLQEATENHLSGAYTRRRAVFP